jgi:hypothetical protein
MTMAARHCYSATPPFLVILRCGDMDLLAARGRVVDANAGWGMELPNANLRAK